VPWRPGERLMGPVIVSIAAFIVSWWLTRRVRRYAIGRQLLDIPNERSSHSVVTPRGGGIAIVVATLGSLVGMAALGALDWPHAWGLFGGGALAAAIGFLDDHRHVAARWRLAVHGLAAAWVLWWFGGMPAVEILGTSMDLGWTGHILAVVYLAWMLNLTNFMDGIDGIAALEAVTVCVGGVLLYVAAVPGETRWAIPLMLAMSALGFLVWNWPPATIFMGDVGSGFLGLMTAALSLQAAQAAPQLLWGWIILLAVFVVDATVTLIRRLLAGQPVYQAHRTHAYQHAAQWRGAHKPVTCAAGAINVMWLLPLALLVALNRIDGATGVIAAYAPLVAAALWLGAGQPRPFRSRDSRAHV